MRKKLGAALTALVTAAAIVAIPGSAGAAGPDHPSTGDIYVSPWGSDRAPGTWWLPVRTLQRARDLVRARNTTLTADLTVHIYPGVQRLSAPLVLDARDSGSGGHRVIWQGSPGTVISGGRQVTGWHPVPGRPGLWAARAPKGLDNTRQLYVDGVREQRARGPLPVTLTATATGYTASADTISHWRNPGDVEFVYTAGEAMWNLQRYGLGQWTEPRCPIGAATGTAIAMAQPCWDNSTRRVEFPDIPGRSVNMVGPGSLTNGKRPAYLENAFELLDQPGEWYLDRAAHTVYYRPRHGEDLRRADVEAPALEKLVTGDHVHDIAFRGLSFEYATWLTPSSPEGFSEIQAGYTNTGPDGWAVQGLCQFVAGGTCPYASWTKEPGNVSVSYGQRVEFSDSVFTHLGAAGLELGDGSQDSLVKGNIFTDLSGNGVEIGGVDKPLPTDDADVTRRVQVLDNHLYAFPREFHGGVAILNGYTQNNLIAHNQIDHLPYSAVSMGWGGWPDKISKPATPNLSHDNQVSNNLIFDYMLGLDDGGGIYTQGITGTSMADGEKVTGNVIYDQGGLGKNVYTDNGCTYETISGNVLYHASYANVASRHTDYRDNLGNNDPTLITGNWWEQGDPNSNNKGLVTQDNHLLSDPSAAPADVVAAAGLEPAYQGLLNRRIGSRSVPEAPWRVATFAVDGGLYAAWNPTFADNGSPLTSYLVTATAGTQVVTATVSAADFARLGYAVVTGLTNGTAYTVTVQAVNAVGASLPSLPAAPATPGPLSGVHANAPTGLKARAGADAVGLQWTPPAVTGDTPVIGYQVAVSDGRTVLVTGRDALISQPTVHAMIRVVNGLQPATKYTFTIAALTAEGPGTTATVTATTPAA
jgi:Fibronectin type III domain/GH141 insertion domain